MKYVNNTLFQLVITTVLMVALGALEIVKPHASVAVPVQVNMPAPKVVLIGGAHPEVQATVYGADWCRYCCAMKRNAKKEMPKDNWILKDSTDSDARDAHIVFEWRPKELEKLNIKMIPLTVFKKSGVEIKRMEGHMSVEDLAKYYNEVGEAK